MQVLNVDYVRHANWEYGIGTEIIMRNNRQIQMANLSWNTRILSKGIQTNIKR